MEYFLTTIAAFGSFLSYAPHRAAPGKLPYDIRVFRKFSFVYAASVRRPENFLTTSVSYGTALLLFLSRVLFVGCTGLLFIFCFLFKALVDIIYILH